MTQTSESRNRSRSDFAMAAPRFRRQPDLASRRCSGQSRLTRVRFVAELSIEASSTTMHSKSLDGLTKSLEAGAQVGGTVTDGYDYRNGRPRCSSGMTLLGHFSQSGSSFGMARRCLGDEPAIGRHIAASSLSGSGGTVTPSSCCILVTSAIEFGDLGFPGGQNIRW